MKRALGAALVAVPWPLALVAAPAIAAAQD